MSASLKLIASYTTRCRASVVSGGALEYFSGRRVVTQRTSSSPDALTG